MKEKILEEFDKKYYSKYLLNGNKIPAFEMNNAFLEDVKQFLSKAIYQTREETIKEIENEINNWEKEDGKSFTSSKIKHILNKLKK